MALSTRSSRMPRLRNWDSTMCLRSSAKSSKAGPVLTEDIATVGCAQGPEGRKPLALAAANFHVEADNAVLIANRNHGDISGHVVLRANDLLRSLGHGCGVGKREIVLHLLLDSHGRAALGSGSLCRQTLASNLTVGVAVRAGGRM